MEPFNAFIPEVHRCICLYIHIGAFLSIKGTELFFTWLKFSFNLYCHILSKIYFWFHLNNGHGFSLNIGKRGYIIKWSALQFPFHSILLKSFMFSLVDCGKSIFSLWFISLIELFLFMHVNLNYCLLNFVRSSFKVEFRCEWWSTTTKVP